MTDKQRRPKTVTSYLVRTVQPYKRKIHGSMTKVKGYEQRYLVPRGPAKKFVLDKLEKKSQTMWLMDRYGRFIGRANSEGVTSAQGVVRSGLDTTTTVRDSKKYKRIYGRVHSPQRKIR